MLGTVTDVLPDWERNVAVRAVETLSASREQISGENLCLLDSLGQLILGVRLLIMTFFGVNWFVGFVWHLC